MIRYLLLFLILLNLTTRAQTSTYYPFPESSATWCCSWNGFTPPDCYRDSTTYQINGTAQINGVIYNRLKQYNFKIHYFMFNGFFCSESDTTMDTTSIFIRQDINLKTVWIYDSFTQTDKVLYDFNLNIGDTLDASKVYWGVSGSAYRISSIDSMLINGTYRKRYNYGTYCGMTSTDSSMVEGIGALHGLLYPPSCFEFAFQLNAMTQNNIILFGDTAANVCHDFTTGTNEIKSHREISLFPNPFHVSATLEVSSDFINSQLYIVNMFGEEVKRIKINSQFTIINRDGLNDGIYLYQIKNSKENCTNGKFILL